MDTSNTHLCNNYNGNNIKPEKLLVGSKINIDFDYKDVFSEPHLTENSFSKLLESDKISSANDIVGKDFGLIRVYNTKVHKEIYSILFAKLINLSEGAYKNTQGICSSTLVGAKGIGKTASLKLFAKIGKYCVPNVMVIYISFNNINNSKESKLNQNSLVNLIISELSIYGIIVDPIGEICENLISSLIKENLRILLLVDELDELYRIDGTIITSAPETIHNLAYFGNQPSGMLAVVVCGSSALMESLITVTANDIIRSEFLLLKTGAVSLNGTKYQTKRVYSTLPTDLQSVASICGIEISEEGALEYLRIVAFCSGCSARSVERLRRDAADSDSLTLQTSDVVGNNNTLVVNDEIKFLNLAILKSLVKKNKKLMSKIFGASCYVPSEVIQNITKIDWERQFQPLDNYDLDKLWGKMVSKKVISDTNKSNLSLYLLQLADRCLLTFDKVQNSRPQNIYPYSLINIANFIIDQNSLPSFLESCTNKIKNGICSISTNPQVTGIVMSAVIVTTLTSAISCNIV